MKRVRRSWLSQFIPVGGRSMNEDKYDREGFELSRDE
jgi:hypothetical protein